MRLTPVGDTALTIEIADAARNPAGLAQALLDAHAPGVTDVVAAFGGVTIFYDAAAYPVSADPIARLSAWVRQIAVACDAIERRDVGHTVELPVHYGGETDGPDLIPLSRRLRLSPDQIIAQHAAAVYRVEAVGFLPGFAYLSGLPTALQTGRRETPRVRVPAGSVAIGGPYTGVYPVASPGGWHLIGRTDFPLFDPARPDAASLRVGDTVRFVRKDAHGG